jgi:hypothetical protein
MKSTELAWAAGFFDGEGCFTVRHSRERPALVLSITQVDRRPLDRFAAILGLKVLGPRTRLDGYNQKPWYLVKVTGKRAEELAKLLSRYLSEPKKEQLAVCLDKVARRV